MLPIKTINIIIMTEHKNRFWLWAVLLTTCTTPNQMFFVQDVQLVERFDIWTGKIAQLCLYILPNLI